MEDSIHGHEVMRMMVESGKQYSRSSLRDEIESTFGEQARFHTCSAFDMSAEDLINFLEARGKFFTMDDGFTTDKSKICNH